MSVRFDSDRSRRAAEQLGNGRGQRLDGVLRRVPRGDLGPDLVRLELGVPPGPQPTFDAPQELLRARHVVLAVRAPACSFHSVTSRSPAGTASRKIASASAGT